MFLSKVMTLIKEIELTKIEFDKGVKLYRAAVEINCLVDILFKEVYNDGLFVRKLNKERR